MPIGRLLFPALLNEGLNAKLQTHSYVVKGERGIVHENLELCGSSGRCHLDFCIRNGLGLACILLEVPITDWHCADLDFMGASASQRGLDFRSL